MSSKILIIGATGFIGSSLLSLFEQNKTPVRVFARTPKKVITNAKTTEVVYGDLDKLETIEDALEGINTIYYLAHAMADKTQDFVSKEINQAKNISKFLKLEQKVIYLSGIIPDEELSNHLEARKGVGDMLRGSKSQTIEFRASIVIGDGSASFEIVRAIVNKLPLIVSAKWSKSKCQPVALKNVLEYLKLAATMNLEDQNNVFDIAGQDVITYDELLSKYASYKKLYRPNIYIPDFSKDLALEVLKIVATEHYQVGSRLLESIEHETILKDNLAQEVFGIELLDLNGSFALLDDKQSSNVKISDFFESNFVNELPQYLVGDSIQIFIPLVNSNFEQFINKKAPILSSFKFKLEDIVSTESYEMRIPKVGRFKFTFNKAKSGIHLIINPEFFFQSLGISILKKILS